MRSGEDSGKGLYKKFTVKRTDGSSAPGCKHGECEYFVLDLMHDQYAAAALKAYATQCRGEFPLLAEDLYKKADESKLMTVGATAEDPRMTRG